MRRLRVGWVAAAAALLWAGSASAAPAVLQVQYDGPMMGGPYGPPPDFDPGMGPYGGPAPYGSGPYRRGGGEARRSVGPFETYHGFRIDLGEVRGVMDVPSAVAEVERQIDIVDRAGLSPTMLAKFRAVPIRISARFADGGGHYRGGPEVSMGSLRPGDDRPVLLHEYMHVLEYRTMPGRFHNPTIGRFYEEARARGLYQGDAYMMSNPAEFFAVTASCFLHGTVAREPYTRAAIRERQPDYYAYLQRLFGPRLETAAAPTGALAAR